MNNTLPFPGAKVREIKFYWQTWSKHYDKESATRALQIQLKRFAVNEQGCWLWMGYRDKDGYGKSNGQRIHRVMYEIFRGPIPKKIDGRRAVLDHVVCDNPPCGNPWHVEPTTNQKNLLRSAKYLAHVGKNGVKTHCKRGHPYDEANTSLRGGKGGRDCRACNRAAVRRYQERKVQP